VVEDGDGHVGINDAWSRHGLRRFLERVPWNLERTRLEVAFEEAYSSQAVAAVGVLGLGQRVRLWWRW
jgi:hypothetical protein